MHQKCMNCYLFLKWRRNNYNPNGLLHLLISTNIKLHNYIEFRHNKSYAYIACIGEKINMFFNKINSNCLKLFALFFLQKAVLTKNQILYRTKTIKRVLSLCCTTRTVLCISINIVTLCVTDLIKYEGPFFYIRIPCALFNAYFCSVCSPW